MSVLDDLLSGVSLTVLCNSDLTSQHGHLTNIFEPSAAISRSPTDAYPVMSKLQRKPIALLYGVDVRQQVMPQSSAARDAVALDLSLVAWRIVLRRRYPQLNRSLIGPVATNNYNDLMRRHLALLEGL